MGYRVIIAEKPSVGKDIARVIGANEAHMEGRTGWREGGGWKGTWAFGHLVGIKRPEEMGFSGATLPMIPERWEIAQNTRKAKDGTMKTDPDETRQLKVIKTLFEGADEIIVATDAGREGELIFRYIYEWAGCTKPFRRLWISSMTDEAIKDGLTNLRPGSDYDNLSAAAHERSRADWLLGFNASKALRLFTGTKAKVSLGRVQTPTLAMICRRFEENKDFKPAPYWTLEVTTASGGQTFTASGVMRYEDETVADRDLLTTRNAGTLVVTSVEKKKVTTRPPLLYDITTIQRAANGRHGYTAAETLAILQSLYEEKLTTYPRTGSRYIPDDVFRTIPALIEKAATNCPELAAAAESLRGATPCRRSVDASKVTDHHALLPTGIKPSGLTDAERNIYDMITARMLEAFGADSVADVTTAELDAGGVQYRARGRVVLVPGWRAVTGGNDEPGEDNRKDSGDEQDNQNLPPLAKGDTLRITSSEKLSKETKPKPIYTDSTLLADMENCANLVDNEAAKTAMKDIGIGTPATRAETIEKLMKVQYAERKGKKIIPTALGLDVYHMVGEREIADVTTTGIWERKLNEIEQGRLSASAFAEGIKEQTLRAIEDLRTNCHPMAGAATQTAACPICGKPMTMTKFGWWCSPTRDGCGLSISHEIFGKKLPQKAVDDLAQGRTTAIIKGFTSKTGKKFDARLTVDREAKRVKPVFDDPGRGTTAAGEKKAGPACPECGHETTDDGRTVTCTSCGLKIWKNVAGHQLTDDELATIMGGGQTNLIDLRTKDGKAFQAKLSWDGEQKKITFTFPARKAYKK